MTNISVFLQFEGSRAVELIELPETATAEDIIEAAIKLGLSETARTEALVFSEYCDAPLDPKKGFGDHVGKHKGRVIVHRCRQIEVRVQFNAEIKQRAFTPAATVESIKRWFIDQIHMKPVDASEHVLQISGTKDRPDPDVHIGALVVHSSCALNFTLVPRKRVEG